MIGLTLADCDQTTTLHDVRLPDRPGRFDIRVHDGRIAAVLPHAAAAASGGPQGPGIDGAGDLALPAFIDGHLHLDKSFLGAEWIAHQGADDVASRIRAERQLRGDVSLPLAQRARYLAETVLGFGTTGIRSHVDIDGASRLGHVETLLALRAEMAALLDIQLVAFPQSGLFAEASVLPDMAAAAGLGVDVIGGLDPALIDGDATASLDATFGLADRQGLPVDIHLHERGAIGLASLNGICDRARALGLQGRVTISHGFCLADLDSDAVIRVAETLRTAGVSVMTSAPGPGHLLPVAQLVAEGVQVCAGSDNIRDAWAPFGNGDMLDRARLLAYRGDFRSDALLRLAFDCVTRRPAEALGFAPRRLHEGDLADVVLIRTDSIQEAVCDVPVDRRVLRRGRLVASSQKRTQRYA